MSYQVLRDPDSGEPVLFLGQKRLTFSELSEINEKIRDPTNGVSVKDRKKGWSTHKQCFVGKELVDLLESKGYAPSKEYAVVLGKFLMDKHVFVSVPKAEHSFKNDDYFYVFEDINKSKRLLEVHGTRQSDSSSTPPTVIERTYSLEQLDPNIPLHCHVCNYSINREWNFCPICATSVRENQPEEKDDDEVGADQPVQPPTETTPAQPTTAPEQPNNAVTTTTVTTTVTTTETKLSMIETKPGTEAPKTDGAKPAAHKLEGVKVVSERSNDWPEQEGQVLILKSTYGKSVKVRDNKIQDKAQVKALPTTAAPTNEKNATFEELVAASFEQLSGPIMAIIQTAEQRPEMHGSSKKITVFKIEVTQQGKTWTIYRRYGQFKDLHTKLKSKKALKSGQVDLPNFGPLQKDPEVKRKALETYLHGLLVLDNTKENPLLVNFLHPTQIGDLRPGEKPPAAKK